MVREEGPTFAKLLVLVSLPERVFSFSLLVATVFFLSVGPLGIVVGLIFLAVMTLLFLLTPLFLHLAQGLVLFANDILGVTLFTSDLWLLMFAMRMLGRMSLGNVSLNCIVMQGIVSLSDETVVLILVMIIVSIVGLCVVKVILRRLVALLMPILEVSLMVIEILTPAMAAASLVVISGQELGHGYVIV